MEREQSGSLFCVFCDFCVQPQYARYSWYVETNNQRDETETDTMRQFHLTGTDVRCVRPFFLLFVRFELLVFKKYRVISRWLICFISKILLINKTNCNWLARPSVRVYVFYWNTNHSNRTNLSVANTNLYDYLSTDFRDCKRMRETN